MSSNTNRSSRAIGFVKAKIKVLIEVAKSDRILQKALAKSFNSHLSNGRDFSNVLGLRGK